MTTTIAKCLKIKDPTRKSVEVGLKTASKSGNGAGKPEFIVSSRHDTEYVMVIECKADPRCHESASHTDYARYAVDGALLYASYLAREFTVIAIAVSGQREGDLKISTYVQARMAEQASALTDTSTPRVPITEIVSWADYRRYVQHDPALVEAKRDALGRYARDLHDYLRDHAKITEAQKPLLVSGILIALMEPGFAVAYGKYEGQELAAKVFQAIQDVIGRARLGVNQDAKKRAIVNAFRFIEDHPELQKRDRTTNESPLAYVLRGLDEMVRPFTQHHYEFDVIGDFYGEFIRYSGGDRQGLGIVLTPKHLTELFADLAKVNKNSVVLDTCCGTGGFLIAAMKAMATGLSEADRIGLLERALIGVEQEPQMFALAVSNMLLRGDGKTNLYQGSCFDEDVIHQVSGKATVGFLNPPFSQKGRDLHEWNFIIALLDALQVNAVAVVVAPMHLTVDQHPLRERLLREHRLDAVMSLHDRTFYPVSTASCAMAFTAHVPHGHDPMHRTWFGYWKDDGFRLDRIRGRVPTGEWPAIRDRWVRSFRRDEVPGESVWRTVVREDEWCAEAYLDTDYTRLRDDDFRHIVLNYVATRVRNGDLSSVRSITNPSGDPLRLDHRPWAAFQCHDLFDVRRGRGVDLNKLDEDVSGVNYVGRTEEHNGVTARVCGDGVTVYREPYLTVPMVTTNALKASYQTEPFCVSQNVAILRLKNRARGDLWTASFLNVILRQDNFRFAYGRVLSLDRLKTLQLKLPVDDAGRPDWEFMRAYLQALRYDVRYADITARNQRP